MNSTKMQKELKNCESQGRTEKLRQVEERLIKLKSDDLYNIVKEEIEKIDCETGGFNLVLCGKSKAN